MLDNSHVEMLDKAVSELMEHFDSVRIFVTSHDGGASKGGVSQEVSRGGGNFYAQLGQVNDWLLEQEEIKKNEISSGQR